MSRPPTQLARELGAKLAKELVEHALKVDQNDLVERHGFPLPEEEIILGAADYLETRARRIRSGGGAEPDEEGSNGGMSPG